MKKSVRTKIGSLLLYRYGDSSLQQHEVKDEPKEKKERERILNKKPSFEFICLLL